jgi:hypothetical protein
MLALAIVVMAPVSMLAMGIEPSLAIPIEKEV